MTIGYTTGVFDLFHVGHLRLLRRSRENCDRLIVGVSTDELVESYKKRRPVIPFEDRAEIVRAIKWVDEVVPQTSMDKYEAWERLHFSKMFHGDDWKGSEMYNEISSKLSSVGVEVIYFPYTRGVSSSALRGRINR